MLVAPSNPRRAGARGRQARCAPLCVTCPHARPRAHAPTQSAAAESVRESLAVCCLACGPSFSRRQAAGSACKNAAEDGVPAPKHGSDRL